MQRKVAASTAISSELLVIKRAIPTWMSSAIRSYAYMNVQQGSSDHKTFAHYAAINAGARDPNVDKQEIVTC